ncbi:P-loop containing nucleoside triphosphate hydrolase protein [Rhexocercosporidium sp. MPI-PUGE-AT-0058]|nr:P-loop containing nucleoside triphosphate hydrolase protein [Rhexocercosporidium sp. MPI-PUGE-AT-0058]
MHNHVPSHGQLQPRPHPSSALRPIQPPRYSTTRGAQLLVNHTPPALANWQEFPSLPGKSKAVPIINPQTGTAHASLVSAQEQPALSKQYSDGRSRICSTAVDGKAGQNSGAQRDSPTESSSREFNIYARPFVPEAFSIINELIPPEGRDIHTKGAKEIDCEVYIGRCIPRDFLPDIPLPIESPMTSPFDLVDGVMHTDYETYFQFHIEAEIKSQMLENETYTLFGHAIKDPIHEIRDPIQDPLGFTTCSILVPGLRENSPYVEEDDVIELRELIYDQSGRLRGMEHWLAQLSQFYGNKPWSPRWRNELSPGWTGFIYHARVLAVQRKDNTLVIRIDQSPDAWRWALPFRESPRFNIQFPVAMARYQPMKLALPIIQKALRHADKTRYHLTNNVRSPPNTPWLQSMLFPVEKDCDKQISLNPGNFKQKFFDDQLNWEQKKAIGSICSRDYGVLPFLISGPPGTGKTKTLVEVALQLIKCSDGVSHILFCAPSDQAADMIVQRTSSHFSKGELLRLNRSSRTFAEVPGAVLPYCWVLEDKFDLPDFQLLMACKLVVTTCRDASLLLYSRVSNTDLIAAESGLRCAINPDATPPTMFQLHWTALIIDEAAQAIEPEALIPLSVVAPLDSVKIKSLPLVIMAGDEHQLGPRTSLPSSPLKTSLFARLFARPVYANHVLSRGQAGEREPKILNRSMLPIARPAFANLIRNYRSHPAILAVPSSLFYFDTLEPEAADTDCLASWSGWRGRKWPVLLHNNNFEDSMDLENGGWHNAGEAQIACKYAAELVQSGLVAQKDICIMSPFKAQVACLRRIMRRPRFGSLWDIDIGPTEAFQGLERSVVILCTTRSKQQFVESDKKANWGVIGMPNVMNVALTRAKYGLIVIGKRDTLFLDANWRAFLEFCERNGLVNGEDSRPVQDKSNTKPSTRLEKVLLAREEEPNESRVLKVYSQEDEMWTFGMQAALDADSSDSYELSDDGEGNDEYEYGENEEV